MNRTPETLVSHLEKSIETMKAVRAARLEKRKPIGGLLDDRFKYVPAASTDIRKTFARIREQQKKGNIL